MRLFELPDEGIDIDALEADLMLQALNKGVSMTKAAPLLGLSYKQLQYRVKKFGFVRIGQTWGVTLKWVTHARRNR